MAPAQSERATSFGAIVQGEHSSAIKKYTKALSYLAEMTSPDAGMVQELSSSNAEVSQQLKAVAVPCLLNRAACSLKLQQPREAIMDCHNVLQTDSTNTKALFRKGQAQVAVRVRFRCIVLLCELHPADVCQNGWLPCISDESCTVMTAQSLCIVETCTWLIRYLCDCAMSSGKVLCQLPNHSFWKQVIRWWHLF